MEGAFFSVRIIKFFVIFLSKISKNMVCARFFVLILSKFRQRMYKQK